MKRVLGCIAGFTFVVLLLTNCVPQRKVQYFRGQTEDVIEYDSLQFTQETIKPHDDLYIKVSSFDDIQYNFFSSQGDQNRMTFNNEISMALISYTVNDAGYIYFPILGNVYLEDKSIAEATQILTEALSEYFSTPTVIVKFINKRVSVIGEVTHAGHFVYTKDYLNIMEAISMAGDVTQFGDLENVYIIREENSQVKKYKIDLTNDELLGTDHFRVLKDDVIYVPPMKNRDWHTSIIPWNLFFDAITTFILLANYISPN